MLGRRFPGRQEGHPKRAEGKGICIHRKRRNLRVRDILEPLTL